MQGAPIPVMAMEMTLDRFDRLDEEASRWLRYRAVARAEKSRGASPLDGLALSLRKLRTSLSEGRHGDAANDENVALVTERAYRFVIRVAKELEGIERDDLDAMEEWARLESFAPFALAFFDRILDAPLRKAAGSASFLKGDIAEVLETFRSALSSSAMAA